jgi:hypothetical protein
LTLDLRRAEAFYIALQAAGMPPVLDEFSVVPQHQMSSASGQNPKRREVGIGLQSIHGLYGRKPFALASFFGK